MSALSPIDVNLPFRSRSGRLLSGALLQQNRAEGQRWESGSFQQLPVRLGKSAATTAKAESNAIAQTFLNSEVSSNLQGHVLSQLVQASTYATGLGGVVKYGEDPNSKKGLLRQFGAHSNNSAAVRGKSNYLCDIKYILDHPLSKWLLENPDIGPDHFEWVRQRTSCSSLQDVYAHPLLQEWLELALKYGPEAESDNVAMSAVREVEYKRLVEMYTPGSVAELPIPGLTMQGKAIEKNTTEDEEEPAMGLSMDDLMETCDCLDEILMCQKLADHLSVDDLLEVAILGEGNIFRMVEIIKELY